MLSSWNSQPFVLPWDTFRASPTSASWWVTMQQKPMPAVREGPHDAFPVTCLLGTKPKHSSQASDGIRSVYCPIFFCPKWPKGNELTCCGTLQGISHLLEKSKLYQKFKYSSVPGVSIIVLKHQCRPQFIRHYKMCWHSYLISSFLWVTGCWCSYLLVSQG